MKIRLSSISEKGWVSVKRIMTFRERDFFYIYTVYKKPTRRNIGLVHCGSGGM
jgi:hypothetical protein